MYILFLTKGSFLLNWLFVLLLSTTVITDEMITSRSSKRATTKTKKKTFQIPEAEKHAQFWLDNAENTLLDHLSKNPITTKAKNVILFIGDGMSIPTITASRIYKGQQKGECGENASLSFEQFPYTGLARTYCVNKQVPDSACTATAYLCGVKANAGTLGVTASVKSNDCKASVDKKNRVSSILEWAQLANKSTGIVTNTRITHATPAGAYAHSAHRDWESDKAIKEARQDIKICKDIAAQLVQDNPGQLINVILGGGRNKFRDSTILSEEGKPGHRKDGVDLIKEWIKHKEALRVQHNYVWNRSGLKNVDTNNTDFLLGLFAEGHMDYAIKSNKKIQPTLAEMTATAINILAKNENGFFLLVEGGRIDHAHHDTQAHRALDETVHFSEAVETAVNMTDIQDTLIVVTADHAHTMSQSGYPERGTNIFSMASISDIDKVPYPILSYANGPGYKKVGSDGKRRNFLEDAFENDDYKFPTAFPHSKESHGGDDVAVFARGPWAHLLVGNYEQNTIPIAMAYASCLGSRRTLCFDSSS